MTEGAQRIDPNRALREARVACLAEDGRRLETAALALLSHARQLKDGEVIDA